MSSGVDIAAVLRRVEQIASAGRMTTGDADATLLITFKRLDALAEDLSKGLHTSDPSPDSSANGRWSVTSAFHPRPLASAAYNASVLNAVEAGQQYVCPECLDVFRPRMWRQMFCCYWHRRAWHNRATTRGAVLFSLVMAARETRDGTRGRKATGKEASHQSNTLMQRWRDEDRDVRMGQVEYLRRRFALGFDAI